MAVARRSGSGSIVVATAGLLVAGGVAFAGLAALSGFDRAAAQTPPSAAERAAYKGLHAAAARGDTSSIATEVAAGAPLEARDGNGRTPLHVAAFASHEAALAALAKAGANMRALDAQSYDVITIAAVADDVPMLDAALAAGGDARLITSPYAGTALIAAAHLGHDEVVRRLVRAGAPLDHVNSLGWTALIEAVILGDGGRRHVETVRILVEAGARTDIADRNGLTPLAHARQRGYAAMVAILERAGAR